MNKKQIDMNSRDLKKIIVVVSILAVISVLIGSFIYIDNSLTPTIKVLAETKAEELANRSINKSVAEIIKDEVNYSDLMNTKVDNEGKITMIESNTVMMNKVASDVALRIQEEL